MPGRLQSRGAPAIVSGALTLILALAAIAWAIKVDLTASFRYHSPNLALLLSPGDARALAIESDAVFRRSQDSNSLALVEQLSRRSLRREVTMPVALRSLALVAAARGDQARANRLMAYSDKLSRRDIPTQLWLIERSVNANDVQGALDHFDKALRASPASWAILMPILVKATDDPSLVGPIATLVSRYSPWRYNFFDALVKDGPSAENLARLERLVDASTLPLNGDILYALEQRYMRDNAYGLAWDLYRRRLTTVRGERPDQVRNGDFDRDPGLTPFEWSSPALANISSYRDAVPKEGEALIWRIEPGAAGEVTRQLILLSQGRYQLRVRGGVLSPGVAAHPEWTVACLDDHSTNLGSMEAIGSGTRSMNFTVPPTCPGIWLVLHLETNDAPGLSEGWIDKIAIVPVKP